VQKSKKTTITKKDLEVKVKELEALLDIRNGEIAHQSKSLANQIAKCEKHTAELKECREACANKDAEIKKLNLSNQSYKAATTKEKKNHVHTAGVLVETKDKVAELEKTAKQLKEQLVATDKQLTEALDKLESRKILDHVKNFRNALKK
jgi:chromosome segregation ATPase